MDYGAVGGSGSASDDVTNYGRMDDDNAAPDMRSETEVDKEDPLTLATEDLLGRVVAAVEDMKRHPGLPTTDRQTVHQELAGLLRRVLEVAAHTGPSVARTYGDDAACDNVYDSVVSDLVLPLMLEVCQSNTSGTRRVAALSFMGQFFRECQKAGSWIDKTTSGVQSGPYGAGGSSGSSGYGNALAMRNQQKRRQQKKQVRQGEILRYWIQASIACMEAAALMGEGQDDTVASRGVLAASAALKPSLSYIAQKIQDADDRGAAKLYGPVMKMIESVLRRLFQSKLNGNSDPVGEGVTSSCIKFMEIIVMCCSRKNQKKQQQQQQQQHHRKRGQTVSGNYDANDHQQITKRDGQSSSKTLWA